MATQQDIVKQMAIVITVLQLTVVLPLFLLIIFSLMLARDMPTWAWVAFWVYVPVRLCVDTICVFRTKLKEADD